MNVIPENQFSTKKKKKIPATRMLLQSLIDLAEVERLYLLFVMYV